MTKLRGVGIGAGYFSQFHYDAWARIDGVEITAVCDPDPARAAAGASASACRGNTPTCREALARGASRLRRHHHAPGDPPRDLSGRGRSGRPCHLPEAARPVARPRPRRWSSAARTGACGSWSTRTSASSPGTARSSVCSTPATIGTRLHSLTFRSRPGDGWGADAYLGRQPYFRTMPRLLVHETGVHFIDTFRFLGGEIVRVYGLLRTLNPAIAGEDCGL